MTRKQLRSIIPISAKKHGKLREKFLEKQEKEVLHICYTYSEEENRGIPLIRACKESGSPVVIQGVQSDEETLGTPLEADADF